VVQGDFKMARTTSTKSVVSQIKAKSKKKAVEEKKPITAEYFISSGSTLLNLALTGNPFYGWQLGKMANIIGDSGTGKTLLVLTSLAEVAHNPKQTDVELVFDDAENALEFDLESCFGEATEGRTEILDPPSENIEQFSDRLSVTIAKGNPFVYVLDSFDALGSEADTKHIESERKIRMGQSKKESSGSYGTAKPKIASQMLREDCGKLKRSKGALLIISQTRDNLTPGSFEKKTRSGGKALKFYATHEVWIILTGAIKAKNRRIGAECLVKVSKNKITGKKREIKFNVYDSYGVDDIGSMVDFLLAEEIWKGGGKANIDTKGDLVSKSISRGKLIEMIESKGLENRLKNIVGRVWNEIEESLKVKRKKRYA